MRREAANDNNEMA